MMMIVKIPLIRYKNRKTRTTIEQVMIIKILKFILHRGTCRDVDRCGDYYEEVYFYQEAKVELAYVPKIS